LLQTLHLFCNGSIFHQNTESNYPPTLKVDLKGLQDHLSPLNSGVQSSDFLVRLIAVTAKFCTANQQITVRK
jgi:hypothetical protein